MKKFFTYLFASAAFCMIGTVNTMAQDVEVDLAAEWWMNYTDEAKPVAVDHEGIYTLGESAVPYGNGSLSPENYAILDEYTYMTITIATNSNGKLGFPRPFMNRKKGTDDTGSDAFDLETSAIDFNKAWAQERYRTANADENPTEFVFNLKKIKEDFGYVHLNGIKSSGLGWGEPIKIVSIKLGKGAIPTAINNVAVETAADGQKFNLAGQKVGKNAKGLYIMNGKKYIKK